MRFNDRNLRESLALLDKSDHVRLVALNVFQLMFMLFDLLAIGLVGIVTSLSIRYVRGEIEGVRVTKIIDLLNLESLSPQTKILTFSVVAASVFVLRSFASYFFARRVALYIASKGALISTRLMRQLFSTPLDSVQRSSTQTGVYFVNQGISQVLSNVIVPFYSIIPDILYLFAIVVSLFYVDTFTMFIVVIILLISATTLFQIQKRKSGQLGSHSTQLNLETSELIAEALTAFREISVRGGQEIYIKRMSKLRFALAKNQTLLKLQSILSRNVLEATMILILFSIGVIQVSQRDSFTSPSNLAIFVTASARILPIVAKLQNSLIQIKAGLASSSEVLIYVKKLRNEYEYPFQKDFAESDDLALKYSQVCFTYASEESRKFRFDLEVKKGEFLVVTGQTGVGKSTLVDLALGIQRPNQGFVQLFGKPPKEFLISNKGMVSYVPQNAFIKNATILENLTFAFPKNFLSNLMIDEIVRKLSWHHLFRNKEMLNVRVGEGGRVLSGGERQVIGIARALVTEPKLVFLDESTSAMDSLTENKILETLLAEREMTVIMVAHRLSVISKARNVLFFEKSGNQVMAPIKELYERNSEFRELHRMLTTNM